MLLACACLPKSNSRSSVLRGVAELLSKRSTSAPPPGSCLPPEICEMTNCRREKKSDLHVGTTAKSCCPCTNDNISNSHNRLLVPGYVSAVWEWSSKRQLMPWMNAGHRGRERGERETHQDAHPWHIRTWVKQAQKLSPHYVLSSEDQNTLKL